MKVAFRIGGSLVLSAIFLYFAARGVSWSEVGRALGEARLVFLVPMALATMLPIVLRAVRWGIFLRPLGPVRFQSLFVATAIGFAANMLLPLRAGEIARPWVLSRREPIGFSQAMATVALERLFDMATLILLFAAATFTLPLPPEWRRYGWFFLGAFAVLLAGLYAMHRVPGTMLALVRALVRPLPETVGERIVGLARGFTEGVASLGDRRALAMAMVQSLGVWLSLGVSFGFGLNALDLEVPWIRGAIATTTFVAIAVSIPGGPGFIGMFQAGCVVALGTFGVEKSLAFSYSVLTHAVQFAATVSLGLYCLLREGVGFAELGRLGGRGDVPATGD